MIPRQSSPQASRHLTSFSHSTLFPFSFFTTSSQPLAIAAQYCSGCFRMCPTCGVPSNISVSTAYPFSLASAACFSMSLQMIISSSLEYRYSRFASSGHHLVSLTAATLKLAALTRPISQLAPYNVARKAAAMPRVMANGRGRYVAAPTARARDQRPTLGKKSVLPGVESRTARRCGSAL